MKISWTLTIAMLGLASPALAGPFPSAADPASRATPSQIARWADDVINYSPAPGVGAVFANPSSALGPANGGGVSLGDLDAPQITAGVAPGSITVAFKGRVFDGPGADLAIFENAFDFSLSGFPDHFFAELAYVEVSSNGVDFARFPSTSLNIEPDGNMMVDADELFTDFGRNFAGVDSTNVYNLAGIHPTGFGTPFDLADLASDTAVLAGDVNLMDIRFVRLVDIPGNGAYLDSLGNPILDTWPTIGSGGLDLDAVGAINFTPEPTALVLCCASLSLILSRRATSRPGAKRGLLRYDALR